MNNNRRFEIFDKLDPNNPIWNAGSILGSNIENIIGPNDGDTLVYNVLTDQWEYGSFTGPTGPTGATGPIGSIETLPDGSPSNPSLAFTNDITTGLYRDSSTGIGFSTQGTTRLEIGYTGGAIETSLVLQGENGSVDNPSYSFKGSKNSGIYYNTTDLESWSQRTTQDWEFNDIAYAESINTLVAVAGQARRIQTSTDGGLTWITTDNGSSFRFTGVTWSPTLNRFVACPDNNNNYRYSSNGIDWFNNSTAITGTNTDVLWVGGAINLFIACQRSNHPNQIATSSSGTGFWNLRTTPQNNEWRALAYSEDLGLIVCVASSGTSRVMTSTNGTTWSTLVTVSLEGWRDVEWSYDLQQFCAVGDNGAIMTSTDGSIWTDQTGPNSNDHQGIFWLETEQQWIVVSNSGTNRIILSTDGVNWVENSFSPDLDYTSVTYNSVSQRIVITATNGGGENIVISGSDARPVGPVISHNGNTLLYTNSNGNSYMTLRTDNTYASLGQLGSSNDVAVFQSLGDVEIMCDAAGNSTSSIKFTHSDTDIVPQRLIGGGAVLAEINEDGQIIASNGSGTLPSLTFQNQTDTGFYLSATGTIGISNTSHTNILSGPTGTQINTLLQPYAFYNFGFPGSIGVDSTLNNFNGIVTGPITHLSSFEGKLNVIYLSQTPNTTPTQYIDLSSYSSSFTSLTEFSIALWFNIVNLTGVQDFVGISDTAVGTTDLRVGYFDGDIFFTLRNNGSTIFNLVKTASAGDWHFITISSGSNGAKLYCDGALQDSSASTSSLSLITVNSMLIGGNEDSGGKQFSYQGYLSQVTFYDRQLTLEDHQSLMSSHSFLYGESFKIDATGIHSQLLLSMPNGSATGPSYSFSESLNAGIYLSESNTISISSSGIEKMKVSPTGASFTSPFYAPSYTVAGIPSASTPGGIIYVSDETGGAVLAFSDGTNWRRVTDRAIVS